MTRNRALRAAGIALLFCLLAYGKVFRYEKVELVRVVDGDTVRLDVAIAPELFTKNKSCRLLRIDAPELSTATGPASRDALAARLAGKRLIIELDGSDSFGRWLVELYADGENISDWMIASGYASPRR